MKNQKTDVEYLTCILLNFAASLQRKSNVHKEKYAFTATHGLRSFTTLISIKLSFAKATYQVLDFVIMVSTVHLHTMSLKLALIWSASLHLMQIFIFSITKQCGVRLWIHSTKENLVSMRTTGRILDVSLIWLPIRVKFAANGTYRKR